MAEDERPRILAVIPALDEAGAVGPVVADLRARGVARVVVADNGSKDATAQVARAAGAEVVFEPRRGYGAAVWKGIEALAGDEGVLVFVNGDGSDRVADLDAIVLPVHRGEADLAIGSRVLDVEPGALSPVQRFGNRLATTLLGLIFGARLTDLGPFRAIRLDVLRALDMRDRAFGWTVEMEARALRTGLRVVEVPVGYRRRQAGHSKISGTLRGSLRAGVAILSGVARAFFQGRGKRRVH